MLAEAELDPLVTEMADGAVAGSAEEVGVERPREVPELTLLPDAQEQLLHQVLRQPARAEEALHEAHEVVLVGAEHCLECGRVAGPDSGNPRAIPRHDGFAGRVGDVRLAGQR